MYLISIALNMFAYWSYLKNIQYVLVAENLDFLFLTLIIFFTDNTVWLRIFLMGFGGGNFFSTINYYRIFVLLQQCVYFSFCEFV